MAYKDFARWSQSESTSPAPEHDLHVRLAVSVVSAIDAAGAYAAAAHGAVRARFRPPQLPALGPRREEGGRRAHPRPPAGVRGMRHAGDAT